MKDLDYQVGKYMELISDSEKAIARNMYDEQVGNEETDYNNFIDWLWDYAHSYLFESGE